MRGLLATLARRRAAPSAIVVNEQDAPPPRRLAASTDSRDVTTRTYRSMRPLGGDVDDVNSSVAGPWNNGHGGPTH